MATRRPVILAFLAALALILSAGVVVRAAPDTPDPVKAEDQVDHCKGGTLIRMGNTTTCTITQTQATGNQAVCNLFSRRPNETQVCKITQTSGAGNNIAHARMRIAQDAVATPFAGSCPSPLRSLANANQNGCQILMLTQTSISGRNELIAKLRITQEIEQGTQQRQNAGQNHTISQKSTTGALVAKVDLFQTQTELAKVIASQFERSTARGSFTQTSAGVARYDRDFKPRQVQKAPAGSTQVQDPDDFCCSGQGTNPADSANLSQVVTQIASQGNATQNDNLQGRTSPTTGIGTVHQSVTRTRAGVTNTTTQNCSQSGGCFIVLFCSVEGCFTGDPR